jgi:hypothetical protein
MSVVDVELLVVAGCPNAGPAADLLRMAIRDAGLVGVEVTTTLIDTPQQAEERDFIGSPTILIDGADPFAEPGRSAALACRVYRGVDGPTGVPDAAALREALRRAADVRITPAVRPR